MRKASLVIALVTPLSIGLTGCAGNLNGQQAGALLGQAVQLIGALNGNGAGSGLTGTNLAAAQPLAGSVTAGLPGSAAPAPVPAGTPPPAVAGTASAADNAANLANAAAVNDAGRANDGRLTLTQYGGPTDRTPDGGTEAGLGNRGNRLRSTSLALSPNLIRQYGLQGGEAIYVRTNQGTFFLGTYDDTTGNQAQDNVIDAYDPTDRLGRDSFIASIPPGGWELAVGQRV